MNFLEGFNQAFFPVLLRQLEEQNRRNQLENAQSNLTNELNPYVNVPAPTAQVPNSGGGIMKSPPMVMQGVPTTERQPVGYGSPEMIRALQNYMTSTDQKMGLGDIASLFGMGQNKYTISDKGLGGLDIIKQPPGQEPTVREVRPPMIRPAGGQLKGVTEKGNLSVFFDPTTRSTYVDTQQGAEPYDVNKHGNILAVNWKSQEDAAKLRASSYANARMTQVYDTEAGNVVPMTVAQFINESAKNPNRYLGTQGLTGALGKNALIEDIRGTINQTKESLSKLPEQFSDTMRTQLGNALKAPDPESAISQLIQGEWVKGLSEPEQNYVISLKQLAENAMAMRSVLGAGQGSDDLRKAILATIPSAVVPTKSYASKQLNAFEGVLDRLKKGVLNIPPVGSPQKKVGGTNNLKSKYGLE